MSTAKTRSEMRRLAVFMTVGGVNTAICYALFAALVHYADWHYQAALAVDYGFGIALGYALHRGSTFADRGQLRRAFGKYTLTNLLTFGANFALLDGLVRLAIFEPLMAQAIAMAAVTAASYGAQKHWVFRSHGRNNAKARQDTRLARGQSAQAAAPLGERAGASAREAA